jgi:hypothetical protein
MTKFAKITDYEGHRLRIMPTNFTTAQSWFADKPVEVVYADVTVLRTLDKPLELGNLPIFQRLVIDRIKSAWVGKPILGTLVKRDVPGHRHGLYPPAWILDDVEVER